MVQLRFRRKVRDSSADRKMRTREDMLYGTLADDDTESKRAHKTLRRVEPRSTEAERRRFLADNDGDVTSAAAKLALHFEWRERCGLLPPCSNVRAPHLKPPARHGGFGGDGRGVGKEELSDDEQWTRASSEAAALSSGFCRTPAALHQVVRLCGEGEGRKETKRVCHVMAMRLDPSAAPASVYALAAALYLDRKLDRSSLERVDVAIDLRRGGGAGWANPPSSDIQSFATEVFRLLTDHCPERVGRCAVYPMPLRSRVAWITVKRCLDPVLASKIRVFCGSAGQNAQPPRQLSEVFDHQTLMDLERSRGQSTP